MLDEDGRPIFADARIPQGGSVDPLTGMILDADGQPVLGHDGHPLYADPRVPPGGSVRADGVILGADGEPLLGDDGQCSPLR